MGRHRKSRRDRVEEARRGQRAEHLLDEVVDILLECYAVTGAPTAMDSPIETVERLVDLLSDLLELEPIQQ